MAIDERVLRVARGMARREVHRLEVVEVGFDFRANADGVAERREDGDDFVHRARDGMLGAGEAARTGQRDVDGFGGESGIAGTGAGSLVEQAFDEFLERLEALADGFLCCGRSGLEPAAETSLSRPCLRPTQRRRKASTSSEPSSAAASSAACLASAAKA